MVYFDYTLRRGLAVSTWPNWVDLVIITLVILTGYRGFGRGFLAELFNLAGAISMTVVCINYSSVVTSWIRPWISWPDATTLAFLVFVCLFLILVLAVHRLLKLLDAMIKWERLYWGFQVLGLLLGVMRGLWWSALILVACTASGVEYLRVSAEERSVLGSHLAAKSRESLEWASDRFPGAGNREPELVPPMRPTTPMKPVKRSAK